MTTNHIDQITEWWESAEEGVVEKGDTVINRSHGETTVYVATERARHQHPSTRILARAPKPAWHDAVAVIAHTACFSERRPFALTHTEDVLDPYNAEWVTLDDLIDPVPLIEAKVTDEMVERGAQAAWASEMGNRWDSAWEDEKDITRNTVRTALTAALGLETA